MNRINSLRTDINEIDESMALLFERRMQIVKKIGIIKQENDLPIHDESREKSVIEQNLAHITDETLHPYYKQFIKQVISLSKEYQAKITSSAYED